MRRRRVVSEEEEAENKRLHQEWVDAGDVISMDDVAGEIDAIFSRGNVVSVGGSDADGDWQMNVAGDLVKQ